MLEEWANSWETDAKETPPPINPCVEVEWSQEWLEHLGSCPCSPKSACPFCSPTFREKFKVFLNSKKFKNFKEKWTVILKRYPCFCVHYCITPQSQRMDMARCLAKEDVKYTHIHRGILFSLKKKGKPVICDNMDEAEGRYAKLHKSDPERPVLHDLTYVWSL